MSKTIMVIDALGCLLVALAVFELVSENTLIPAAWQFPYYPHAMLTLGILLVLPMVVVALLRARRELELRKLAKDTAAALKSNRTQQD